MLDSLTHGWAFCFTQKRLTRAHYRHYQLFFIVEPGKRCIFPTSSREYRKSPPVQDRCRIFAIVPRSWTRSKHVLHSSSAIVSYVFLTLLTWSCAIRFQYPILFAPRPPTKIHLVLQNLAAETRAVSVLLANTNSTPTWRAYTGIKSVKFNNHTVESRLRKHINNVCQANYTKSLFHQ